MSARTTNQMLSAILSFLPPQYSKLSPLLAGAAAVFHAAESLGDDLVEQATIGGADPIWLDLIGRGYGVDRATGESQASYRARLRRPGGAVSRQPLLDAVNALIGSEDARIVEWWDGPYVGQDYVGQCYPSGGANSFLIFIPVIGEFTSGDAYVGGAYVGIDAFLGHDGEAPVYEAILAEIEKLRATGTRWALVLESA